MVTAFVDANVLVSVLNKEYPLFTHSSRVLSLADKNGFQLFTSPLCLAIGFYFASKKCGEVEAKRKIQLLYNHLSIAQIDENAVKSALNNPKVNDIEGGFQYYAAVEAGCNCLITENLSDYYFSEMPVFSSEQFLKAHVFKS
ncbi:PIN domain-containing protein [Roseivirga sp.]|uniref:PIN domain-containing protein n=1 Tax=Roseivirga sp. TaxID=1964215 RepID=UPI002B26989E|nr:PIN domain-containing protein [Roseivirga sp.]